MSLGFQGICYTAPPAARSCGSRATTLPSRKDILQNVTGFVPAGQSLLIMGGSGSGKTTLLNALAGRLAGDVRGTVLYDGKPRPADFRLMSGYVMQDDALIPTLTVRDTLSFAFALRTDAARAGET